MRLETVSMTAKSEFEIAKRELKLRSQTRFSREKFDQEQIFDPEKLKLQSERILEQQKREIRERLEFELQHKLNKMFVAPQTTESHKLQSSVDLLKLKQAISQEYQQKTDDLVNEARSRDHFMDGYLKIIKSIETSKKRLHEMRAQRMEIEDEISVVVQQRSLL